MPRTGERGELARGMEMAAWSPASSPHTSTDSVLGDSSLCGARRLHSSGYVEDCLGLTK